MDQSIVIALNRAVTGQPGIATATLLLAQLGILVLPVAVGLLWLRPGPGQNERRQLVIACALAFGLAAVLSQILAPLIDRPRPSVALGLVPLFAHAADSSFPSDHTLLGVSLVGPLTRRWPRAGAALIGWALLVGLARMAAGVHYPSDVLGSALLALLPIVAALAMAGPLVERLPVWVAQRAGLGTDRVGRPS